MIAVEELTAENCNDILASCKVRTVFHRGNTFGYFYVLTYPLEPPPPAMTLESWDEKNGCWRFDNSVPRRLISVYCTYEDVVRLVNPVGHYPETGEEHHCVLELRRRGFWFRPTSRDLEEGAGI